MKRLSLMLSITLGIACGYPDGTLEIPAPTSESPEASVYPVLLRDCGFPACHGTHERFLQVFGPGRTRLLATTDPYADATPEELDLTLARARSMLIDPEGIEHSLLLRKPLTRSEGGAGHRGDDIWGRAVYGSKDDEGYRMLLSWALSSEPSP